MLHFFLYYSAPPRDLHSFPTRRSSDLCRALPLAERPPEPPSRQSPGARCWLLPAFPHLRLVVERAAKGAPLLAVERSEEHTSELQSRGHLVCRLLLEKKNNTRRHTNRY